MRNKYLALQLGIYILLLSRPSIGQTATYHLHKEASTVNTTFDKLLTAGPDAKSISLSSSSLTNKAAGEYVIKEFETQTGVPNASGVIPSGSTMTFVVWMNKSANAGTVLPDIRLRLNSATGTSLCSVIGSTGLTTTITKQTLTCTTSAPVTVTSTDRFYLWVGIDLTQTSGSNNFSGGLSIEGTLNGSTDSLITVQLPVPLPVINTLTPTTGAVGSSVVIAGSNFGASQGNSSVTFNGTAAAISNWTATSITAIVPSGATSGPVVVTVNGQASNGVSYVVFPFITSLTPSAAGVGTSVTIAGANFGATQGTSTVSFNGTAATPSTWSDTSITAPVPAAASSGPVVVTVGGHASNGAAFTVTPTITSLAPTAGPIGTVVTINGSKFGATRGSSTVTFAGITATPATWSDTQITAAVPAGVALGAASVVVTVPGSGSSNSASFTVVAPLAISASPSPAANANGWNNSNVTVSYTCTGGAPPVQCPPAQTVSTEGANQVISATAADANGVTATASVTLKIDKTGPAVTITSPQNNTITTASTQQVTGTVVDSLSGIATVFCNGSPATIQNGSVSCTATLVSGTNVIPISATDVAGNTTTQAVGVVVGAPAITDFNPKSGAAGNVITITGTNLALGLPALAQITLNRQGGGTITAPVTNNSPTSVSFLVPPGATDGVVTLTTVGETAVSTATLSIAASTTFSITAGPATANVLQGQSAAYSISLNSANGFSQLASLSVSGLPTGVTASFNPSQITNGQISILTVNAPTGQTPGSSTLTVSASATVDGIPSTQTATATLAVQALSTSFFGRILESDAIETPIPAIRIVFLGKDDANNPTGCSGSTSSDAAGNFLFTNLPTACTGRQLVWYNGSTSTDGELYAGVNLAYTINTGQATGPEMVHLPRIDNAETIQVHQNWPSDQVLTYTTIPNITVTVYANTIFTLPDGTTPDPFPFTAVQVPVDRLPDAPVDGPGTLRAFIVAFQPDDTMASQPVSVNWPNYLNTPPGVNMELDTLDPVAGMLIKYGTGTVAGDGSQIIPDLDPAHPGHRYGIQHFDWHGPMAPTPNAMNPNPNGPQSGDPVDPATGILTVTKLDLSVTSQRGSISIVRTYRTMTGTPGPFGVGTNHNYSYQLNTFGFIQGQASIGLVMPDGNQFPFVQQPDGTLINITIPVLRGVVMTATNGAYTLRWKDGTVFNFQSPPTGVRVAYLNSIADPNGNTITLVRGNSSDPSQITQVTDPVGRSILLSYDSFDRITSIIDPLGRTVTYTYNGQGTLATVTNPAGGTTQYGYDSNNRMTDITDPRGILFLHNDYDGNGKIIKQTAADGSVTQFAYTLLNPNASVSISSGTGGTGGGGGSLTVGGATTINTSPVLLTTVTDPLGHQFTYHFNAQGFLIDTTDALGRKMVFTRDSGTNMVSSVTDPLNRSSQFVVDAVGNINGISRTGPTHSISSSNTYEAPHNQIATITDPLNHSITFSYDGAGNRTAIKNALNETTAMSFNSLGEQTAATDPLNNVTSFSYDVAGNLSSITDPLNRVTTRVSDAVGRTLSITNSLGQTKRYEYNALNLVSSVVDALANRTSFAYDANGNLLKVTDPLGNQTQYGYDNMDRLVSRKDQLGASETYAYDLAGNLISFTDRRGVVTTYQYDELNRRVFVGFGTQPGPVYESTVRYTYDAANRLVQINDSITGIITRVYDDLDRLVSETTSLGMVSYAYDAAGRRTSMAITGQTPITYAYDDVSRISRITQGTSTVQFAYDKAGRRSSVTLPNSIVIGYQYDPASQLTALAYTAGTTLVGNVTYSYDQSGRVSGVGGTMSAPLLPAPLASASYNAASQLTQRETGTLTYDANGNLVNDGTNTYTWDGRNHLVAITSAGGQIASFQYDPFGRRVTKTVGGQTTSFLYDFITPVEEFSGGTPITTLAGLRADETFLRNGANGPAYFLSDSLGSTLALLNANGTVETQYAFDPFGNTTGSGASSDNPYQYIGRENDGTGLYYLHARYYSPQLDRFISADPIGFAGGSFNLYTYSNNDPLNLKDPSGRSPCLLGGLLAANAYLGYQIFNELTGRKSTFGPGISGAWNGLKATAGAFGVGCALFSGGEALIQAGLSTPVDGAVFYSGYPEALAEAQQIGTTIGETTTGSLFESVSPYLPKSLVNSGWNYLSGLYAEAAQGEVNIVISEAAQGSSVFWQTEFPTLVSNPNVTNWVWTLLPK
ncbi:MAG TPA: IPT/TIG domain-containing protein [Candidatus Angelobacter sp.]|nr:IPT/TIG domain-containing protein [Candidatus Angelobacter sp.]